MIKVTDTIKKAYDTSTTQCDKIILDNIEYAIINVQYSDDCYNEGNIFGTAIARTLQFEIENNINLEGKEFEYLTGIKIGNNVEWISLGNFIVESVEPNDTTNINTVNAMDYMLKSNIEYVSSLNYESGVTTLLQVLQEACTNAGLVLGTTNFPNKDFIVDSNQFEQGTLIRQVIQAVAQISGTVAKIKSDNKLYLINPNSVTEISKVFTLNDYADAEIKRATHPINLVSLGMSDVEGENITLRDEESIEEDGENSLVINNNPFAYTQAKREQLITALFNAVKGFEYKAFLFNCQGLPYLETMDKIQFKDKQGNTYNSYVFRFNYKSPNGLESQIEAPSIIKATVNYQNIPSVLDRLKRTELIVDKQNQTITGLVEETTENSEKLAQQQITIDGITQKVENVVETTKTVKGIQTITLDNCVDGNLLELRIFGHNTNFDFLFPDEDLFPSDDLFPNHDEENMTATYMVAVAHEDGTSEVYRLAETYWLSKNSETQDMYELKDGKATITRRVNIYDGTTQEEEIEELGVKSISLKAGTNTITLLSRNATIEAKYAIQNEYTKNFATKVEMNAAIEIAEDNINLSVEQKLEGYSTTEEMNSAIEIATDQINAKVENVATYANAVTASGEAHLTETQEGTENVIQLRIFGETTTGRLELVSDKQSKSVGQSSDAFVHLFELEEKLLEKNGVYDEITIEDFKAKLIKRLAVNESFISNSSFEVGNINSGGIETSSESMVRSDYTAVLAEKEYKITKKESDLVFMYAFFYNSSKEFISRTDIGNYQTPYSTTFTTPANSAYVRIVLNGNSYGAAIDFDVTKEEVVLKLNKDDIYELDEEMIIDLGTVKVQTFDTDTYVYIKNQTLNYYCRYLTDNDFTRIYAKKAEVKITTDNISSEVSKKVGNNEIISKINQSAEEVAIAANRVNFNGAISANGNFKIGTDGKMECTGAKINVEDDGTDKESASIIAESANRIAKLTSFGLFIEPKASGHMTEYVNVGFGDLASVDSNGYGFNFAMTNYATSGGMKENRAYWNVKDSAGDLLFADDTQFNLFSPGENTNLSLRNNGAFINGYQIQTNSSDRRLKTNIQDSTENALDKIMQIQHRSFTWKENGQEQKNGYIAQELEQIDKEFVIVNDDKYSINLLNVLSTVTKAMQEQQEQIEQLKQELNTLKGVEK